MTLVISVIFVNNGMGNAFRAVQMQSIMLLSSATLIFVVGLTDDLKRLSARTKFLLELLVATALCFGGLRISRITLTDGLMLSLGGWGYALTILWIVGITNAVNLSDGLDGLAAGICSIACGVIALFAFLSGSVIMGVFMLALLGSLCGFLVFNFHPAKVFMGDCGSLFLGFMIAASSVMCTMKSAALVGLALPALALGVPIFDTLFSMLRRFLERRSLFAPDRNHFHHRLLKLGLNQRRAVLITYMVTLLATGLGLLMLASNDIHSLFVFGGTLLLIVFVFCIAGAVQLHAMLARLRQKCVASWHERHERGVFEDHQLRFQQARDVSQWWQALCQIASQMDFAWISLKTTYEDGRTEEELWRAPRVKPDMSRILTVAIPLDDGDGRASVSRWLTIAICAEGSVESAGRRATLFGRLIDEYRARAGIRDQKAAIAAESE
jgi:UDP-GlcNAc:undecaprenyl-phosphate GlcNAc-1-phosphate transferase